MVLVVPRWFPGALGALAVFLLFSPILWLALQSALGLVRPATEEEWWARNPPPPYRAAPPDPARAALLRSRAESWCDVGRGAFGMGVVNALGAQRWAGAAIVALAWAAVEVARRWFFRRMVTRC